MSLEEIKKLVSELMGSMHGAHIRGNVNIYMNVEKVYNDERISEEKKEKQQKQNTDEVVGRTLAAMAGEGKPINCKQKWAGAYWYLRWAYNYPVDPQEFCKRIQNLPYADGLEVSCNYENIRKLATLSFMEQDPRQMDKVKPSKMDNQAFMQCREIALLLEEKLGKTG